MKVGSYVRTYGAKCAKRNNQQMHMDMWNETEIKVAEHMSTDMWNTSLQVGVWILAYLQSRKGTYMRWYV
jgi:hypothetical protein